MIDLSQTVLDEGLPLVITRPAGGSYTKGRWVGGGAPSTVNITAVVYPITAREAAALPEGIRDRGKLGLITTTQLRAAGPATGGAGDRFTYVGTVYEVISVEPWEALGGFWRCAAALVEA